MSETSSGTLVLPDLTQLSTLLEFGKAVLLAFLIVAVLSIGVGVVIALINFSMRRSALEPALLIGPLVTRYTDTLRVFQHGVLVLLIVASGLLLCSTLANRYHHWEQARITKISESVAGERIEQSAPRLRYVIQEPYTYKMPVDGKLVQVEETRDINRFMDLAGSQVQATVDQVLNTQSQRAIYRINFVATYQVTNRLGEPEDFFFEVSPPKGYTLLQGFTVEREGARLPVVNPGDYGFPFRLEAGAATQFRVTYQAQGAPRWVYNAENQLLSNFRLTVQTNVSEAEFASGIVPTDRKPSGQGTIFTWDFKDNVSVLNPFGVFTATSPIRNTGILPRLLVLGPAIFLWWLLLLYLSVPLTLRQVACLGGVFFANLLALTYLSRVTDSVSAWAGLSGLLLILVWILGPNRRFSLAAILCTLSGAILPILGLLVPYSGLTLGGAGLLSAIWLAVRQGHFDRQRGSGSQVLAQLGPSNQNPQN
jgi:hypothetical protein